MGFGLRRGLGHSAWCVYGVQELCPAKQPLTFMRSAPTFLTCPLIFVHLDSLRELIPAGLLAAESTVSAGPRPARNACTLTFLTLLCHPSVE